MLQKGPGEGLLTAGCYGSDRYPDSPGTSRNFPIVPAGNRIFSFIPVVTSHMPVRYMQSCRFILRHEVKDGQLPFRTRCDSMRAAYLCLWVMILCLVTHSSYEPMTDSRIGTAMGSNRSPIRCRPSRRAILIFLMLSSVVK
jgi:hypothetical protein